MKMKITMINREKRKTRAKNLFIKIKRGEKDLKVTKNQKNLVQMYV